MDLQKIKLIILGIFVILAFVLVPNLGKDIMFGCKDVMRGIQDTSSNLSKSMQDSNIMGTQPQK